MTDDKNSKQVGGRAPAAGKASKPRRVRRAAPVVREWVGASDMFDAMREERQRRGASPTEAILADVVKAVRKERKRPGSD